MYTKTILLGNRTFSLDTSPPASARRRAYIQYNKGSLLPDEQAILTMLGIDADMEEQLKPYLGDFFDALPECQSDTSLYLHKRCEIPYYVIWTTQFASHALDTKGKEDNRKAFVPETDVEMAIDETFVHDVMPELSDIDLLFTMIQTLPQTEYDIYALFTLMQKENQGKKKVNKE
jgi:hypothetical protein